MPRHVRVLSLSPLLLLLTISQCDLNPEVILPTHFPEYFDVDPADMIMLCDDDLTMCIEGVSSSP